jgi:hypothetical protein
MGQGPETRFEGSCHCGAVAVSFATRRPIQELPLRECQCSFCRKHGARTTADPEGLAEIRVNDRDALARYRFALGTADYLVCAHCGVYLAAVMEEEGKYYAVLNINAFDVRAEFAQAAVPMVYDHEDETGRRARRRKLWTPAAVVSAASAAHRPGAARRSSPAPKRERPKQTIQKRRPAKK